MKTKISYLIKAFVVFPLVYGICFVLWIDEFFQPVERETDFQKSGIPSL